MLGGEGVDNLVNLAERMSTIENNYSTIERNWDTTFGTNIRNEERFLRSPHNGKVASTIEHN